MNPKSLHFHGPYNFTKGETSLFHSEFTTDEGIYLWVIKDTDNNINYIHYIGETTGFAKRQKEHLTQMLGLNYYVIDADLAKHGIHKVIWKGMWRDKSNNAAGNVLETYNTINNDVLNYIEVIDIYFAPTELATNIRKHIEGCIGWNLRKHHYDLTEFYPDDNRVVRSKNLLNEKISISSDQPIAGLDSEIEI